MKGKIRIAYLAFFLVFILSLFTIKVFADEEEVEPATDAPPPQTAAPPQTVAPKTKATQAPTKKVTAATKATQAATKRQTYATKSYNNNSNNNNNNVNNNTNRYTYATRATQKPIVSSTKAQTSPVYDTDKEKVATDTLKKNDWNSIKEQLSKPDSDDTKTNVENFDYIKKNTSEDDNGIWIIYTGVGLVIAGALIIITLIILAVRRRGKMKAQRAAEAPRGHSRAAEREPREYRSQREDPRYSHSGKSEKRSVNKRSKFDTDEINVNKPPRRSGGGRYKPRH